MIDDVQIAVLNIVISILTASQFVEIATAGIILSLQVNSMLINYIQDMISITMSLSLFQV